MSFCRKQSANHGLIPCAGSGSTSFSNLKAAGGPRPSSASRWPRTTSTTISASIRSFPSSLVIEGMAQTGGLLVCEHNEFTEKVILAKVPKVQFYLPRAAGRHAHLHGNHRIPKRRRRRGQRHEPYRRAASGGGRDRLCPFECPVAGHIFLARSVPFHDAGLRRVSRRPRGRRQPAAPAAQVAARRRTGNTRIERPRRPLEDRQP